MAQDRSTEVLDAVPIGIMRVDREWRVTYLNPSGGAVVGYTPAELVGRDYWDAFPANVDGAFGPAFREIMRTRQGATVEAWYPEPLNAWFEVQTVPEDDGGLAFYFTDVTERRMAQDRLAVLAAVSAEVAGEMDVAKATARIPQLLAPALADWCILTLLDDDGRPRDVGWWHPDPVKRPALDRYATIRMSSLPASAPIMRVLRGEEAVAAAAAGVYDVLPEGGTRAALMELAPRHGVAIALRGRARTLGALTLWYDGGEPSEPVLDTAREVAERLGLALDNVRLFHQQRQLAEELQRSLLTGAFEHPQAEIAVRYTPAAEAARVGGDWYDAFLQPSEAMMLVIGDVVGHDTAAAAAMGQLRALLRGIASYSDAGPGEVLRGLDAAMAHLRLGTYATAAVARLEQTPDEAARGVTRMRWSNAGHLPPLVIHPDGTLAALAEWKGGLLLGVDPTCVRTEQVVALTAGTTVLLYTDGLIERRDSDLDEGVRRLRAAAADLAGRSPDELCDELLDRLVQGRPDDDVALVAIRLRG
ncbi:SpoIIE family protein phosphatase [Modestobacter sp. NPDC049651]|uniref:SpoIIE family protein phosphatase n=1 Tax=unclassified Modestobacter TaxID=2643866 RepID=UPI0033E03B1A